jgi:phage tail-like protein
MDVNGLRVWQVADPPAFAGTGDARHLQWRSDTRTLRLDREQAAPSVAEDATFAISMAQKPSPVRDAGGSYAWWDSAAGGLRSAGFGIGAAPIAIPPDTPPGVPQPTDLAFGTDDVLYVARNDGVVMLDRRERWRPARVDLPGFRAHRLAPAPDGGVWALDRVGRRLARLSGHPLRSGGITDDPGETFRPHDPNPRPPRLRLLRNALLPADSAPIAIAASPGGNVAVLAWRTGEDAALFTLESGRLVRRFALASLRFPYAIAWVGEDRVAVIASDGPHPAAQAFVYECDSGDPAPPTGEVFRLLGAWHGGFCNTLGAVPDYPLAGSDPDTPGGLRKLHRLSRATYARGGSVTLGPFDAGESGCVWHRLYLEASLPPKSGIRIAAFADDFGGVPPAPGLPGAPDWSVHLAGSADGPDDAPRAAWCAEPSEMPFAPALHACPPVADRSGLFTLLLQRAGRHVRRIEGRYLYLHLTLLGDSQVTPELAAVRVYAQRFAWRDRYLPALYRETLAGSDGDEAGRATPPDFLDRFLHLFEGPLTQLEGKVAGSWLLTDPRGAPEAALPWLAHWIGLGDEAAARPTRLRQALRAAPHTARLHGTLGGLLAALEIASGGVVVEGGRIDPHRPVPRPGQLALATLNGVSMRTLVLAVADPRGGGDSVVLAGGAVTRGEIVALEGFRLRRTFATILGADLADEDDALTLGLATTGNSFVGDTLILGDAARREILAAFSAEIQTTSERAAVLAFFERLAHRVLVLVRRGTRTADLGRLKDVAAAAAPAHVETTMLEADRPLIVGAASLVGVDTFLLDAPPARRARVSRSRLGTGDLVMGEGRLDARADGPISPPPRAVADGPAEVWSGTGFLLSAARSEAAAGRSIERNIWTWV